MIIRFDFTLSNLKYQKFFLLAETGAKIKYKSSRIVNINLTLVNLLISTDFDI